MQELPNKGDTIFHKFKGTDFTIAIVLFTKDPKLTKETKISHCKTNLILEAGYFYAY